MEELYSYRQDDLLLNLVWNSKWKPESSPELCENSWHEIPTLLTRITNTMCPLGIWVTICYWNITRKALLGTAKQQVVWKWIKLDCFLILSHIIYRKSLQCCRASNYTFLNIGMIIISILNDFYLKRLKSALPSAWHTIGAWIYYFCPPTEIRTEPAYPTPIYFLKIYKHLLRTTSIGIIGDVGLK